MGLRPNALHIPVTQVGCTGGVWSLALAADLVAAQPGLREHGNTGGPAVLDVLRRIHEAPPPHGARGLVAAFGPGFFASAVAGTWQDHD